jgi:hypothetical protein
MAQHTDVALTYEMDQYSGNNWLLAVVEIGTNDGDRKGFITSDHVHIDEYTPGDPEADVRLWAASPRLLAAMKMGIPGTAIDGPDLLFKVANILDAEGHVNYAGFLRVKAKIEKAAIARAEGRP